MTMTYRTQPKVIQVTMRTILHCVSIFCYAGCSTCPYPLFVERLASSIHAIYRPFARTSNRSVPGPKASLRTPYNSAEEESSDTLLSEDDPEAEDFEETPRVSNSRPTHVHHRAQSEQITQSNERQITPSLSRIIPTRAGSMTTVRVQRRAGLAEKLREVFELDGIEEVRAGELICACTNELSL